MQKNTPQNNTKSQCKIALSHRKPIRASVKALLVYANKQDLHAALPASEMADKLGLNAIRGTDWYIQPCVATSGEGVFEGIEWLSKTLYSQFIPISLHRI